MDKTASAANVSSTQSPGQILARLRGKSVDEPSPMCISGDPFRPSRLAQICNERGVMLAPILVLWHYRVAAAKPFSRWLATKDILLSDARLGLHRATNDIHYFGTYILQQPQTKMINLDGATGGDVDPVSVQTIWGFSKEPAMRHLFDLCSGRIDRVSLVENDLYGFVSDLKKHINQVEQQHFSQTVLLSSAVA